MHHKFSWDPLTKTYKTVITEDFNKYPEFEVQDTVNCIWRIDRKDLYLEKKLAVQFVNFFVT